MKVLIVGGGGREHALAWKAAQSRLIDELHVAPGNPGIGGFALCHRGVKATDIEGQVALARKLHADLVIVGMDDALALGLVDRLHDAGIKTFGPAKEAARLEWSKGFAKEIMTKASVPTARYGSFTDYEAARAHLEREGVPIVIKADGLALGKGVSVCTTMAEAEAALKAAMLDRAFGEAGARVLIEEFMKGDEVSILAFSDGRTIKQMVSAQDHKPVGDGDTGPNTGGMGTYAPVPAYTPEVARTVQKHILEPVIAAMADRGAPFVGCLFAGLMLTADGPKVLEFNARFGDPEAQVVLPLLENDLLEVLLACVEGRLKDIDLRFREGAAANVVVASPGYPGGYPKGLPIHGLDKAEKLGVRIFHAGTALDDNGVLVTAGGRVLGVMAVGADLREALSRAYAGVEAVQFEGKQYRRDIGWRSLREGTEGRPLR
ncbi:MAG: phosphoribosylamine--glycine ligase [Deltaproteobacteria bacterium HGW-Deltaproteobacteria-21]|nr:MAG: phosphoribosylamine--glycine ligase [Deltaproteobacteria bacterium HGW-Deltaproteobacteria-21]